VLTGYAGDSIFQHERIRVRGNVRRSGGGPGSGSFRPGQAKGLLEKEKIDGEELKALMGKEAAEEKVSDGVG